MLHFTDIDTLPQGKVSFKTGQVISKSKMLHDDDIGKYGLDPALHRRRVGFTEGCHVEKTKPFHEQKQDGRL